MSDDIRGFGRLIRERRSFRRLWYANMVSLLGDWLSYVAVSMVAVEKGGSAVAVGLVLVAHALPMALMAPISGPLADRFDRRKIMIGANIGASVLTFVMYFTVAREAVWWMQLLLLSRVAVSGLGLTARLAALPQVVEKDELHAANALFGLTWSMMFTLGVALGGVLTAVLGPGQAVLLDAVSFLLAASVLFTLPPLMPVDDGRAPPRPGLRDLLEALRYARPRPRLLSILLAKSPPSVASAGGWVVLNLVAGPRIAGSTALGLGVMHALRAVGTGIGPLLPRHWLPRQANIGTPLAFIGLALFLLFDTPWLFLPALVLWGIGTGHNWVSSTAELQSSTPPHILGRMTASDLMILQAGQSVAAVGAGLIIDLSGSTTAGAWITLGVGLSWWGALMMLRRRPDAADAA